MPLKQISTSKESLEALEKSLSEQLPGSVKTLFTIQLHLRLGVNKGLCLYQSDNNGDDDTLVMLYPDTVPTGTAISIHCQNNADKLQKVPKTRLALQAVTLHTYYCCINLNYS